MDTSHFHFSMNYEYNDECQKGSTNNLNMFFNKASKLAHALRRDHTTTIHARKQRTAVVVGSTSGIGQACAKRLAQDPNWTVIAVGRDRPGRSEEVLSSLNSEGGDANSEFASHHEFYGCDAFSLDNVQRCSKSILKEHETIDALIMSQGMATIQGFTPTAEGNDEKLSLHYWSRMAFVLALLPALHKSDMPGGAVVLSILSGGVHNPYEKFREDPELKNNYSIQNAADIAGFYNDLGLDVLSRCNVNAGINFIHAAPGFVNTNWGTEMPWYLKGPIRAMQKLGRDPMDVAEIMLDPVFKSETSQNSPLIGKEGVSIMDHNGNVGNFTKLHDKSSRDFVWSVTKEVLQRSGISVKI